jgi:hypothetical protein
MSPLSISSQGERNKEAVVSLSATADRHGEKMLFFWLDPKESKGLCLSADKKACVFLLPIRVQLEKPKTIRPVVFFGRLWMSVSA